MIAVVNYGVGNVKSVLCALVRSGAEATLTSDPAQIRAAAGVILPGVGAFSTAMENLRRTGLDGLLTKLTDSGKPVLGICLGMQLFFTESEEHGKCEGLGLLEGRVRRFPPGLKVPHMGWNEVRQNKASALLDDIDNGSFFYFAHSYYVEPKDANVALGVTEYGEGFVSAIASGRLFGVQFHPEKSGPCGLRLLANFCRLCERDRQCWQSA